METKMLRKKGTDRVFPFTEILAQRDDMEIITVSKGYLIQKSEKIKEYTSPGRNWVKNKNGFWTRRKK